MSPNHPSSQLCLNYEGKHKFMASAMIGIKYCVPSKLIQHTWQSILSVIPPCPGMLSPKSFKEIQHCHIYDWSYKTKKFDIRKMRNLDFKSSLKATSKEAAKRSYYWWKQTKTYSMPLNSQNGDIFPWELQNKNQSKKHEFLSAQSKKLQYQEL